MEAGKSCGKWFAGKLVRLPNRAKGQLTHKCYFSVEQFTVVHRMSPFYSDGSISFLLFPLITGEPILFSKLHLIIPGQFSNHIF